MALAFRSGAAGSSNNSSFVIVSKPPGFVVGDLLVALITIGGGSTAAITQQPGVWFEKASAAVGTSGRFAVWTKEADAADVAGTGWTFTRANGYWHAVVAAYSGGAAVDAVNTNAGATTATTHTAAAITTAVASELVLFCMGGEGVAAAPTTVGTPAGYTERWVGVNATGWQLAYLADILQAAAGSSGTPAATTPATLTSRIITMGLRESIKVGSAVQGGSTFSALAGRKVHSKYTLASAGTLLELHAWVTGVGGGGGSGANNVTISLYADSAGAPAALLATTASIPVTSSVDNQHLSQAGFNVALAAGSYWVGVEFEQNHGAAYYTGTGTYVGVSSGAAWNPPSNPYGTPDLGDAVHGISAWGVVGASSAVAPVANFTGTPLSGPTTLAVAFTDSSTNTPTSWAWDFGDGGTSTSQNPSHNYTTAGTFTVVLVATNAAGGNTKTRTGYVVVSQGVPSTPRADLIPSQHYDTPAQAETKLLARGYKATEAAKVKARLR